MAFATITVFLLLFLSGSRAKKGEMKMIYTKQEITEDNGKSNITVDVWTELKELRDMVITQKVELTNKIETLEEEKTAMDARLSATESEVQELKRQLTDSPKVAFSVGLTNDGTIGPFTTDVSLKFGQVVTNFGQAYNPYTGVFTAPVRGVYYFRFSVFINYSNADTGAFLYHNDKQVGKVAESSTAAQANAANAFVLELEKGDAVFLMLHRGEVVFDNGSNRTTFSGFLIFPL